MEEFSCFITITNLTGATMVLQGEPIANYGSYIINPLTSIPNKSNIYFLIQQKIYLSPGPQGSCIYAATDNSGNQGLLQFSYSCPLMAPNTATAVIISGSTRFTIDMVPYQIPETGHPIRVEFTIISS
jgi:hypothetical protein